MDDFEDIPNPPDLGLDELLVVLIDLLLLEELDL